MAESIWLEKSIENTGQSEHAELTHHEDTINQVQNVENSTQ